MSVYIREALDDLIQKYQHILEPEERRGRTKR
jgi:hypothetical protein